MTEKCKIPVLIVTGFLGAGKTTFINHLIKTHPHLKLALIENEFGETSVDSELIAGIDGNQIFELSNGCICCSISNEFSLALNELADKLHDINYLLIETTGIANLSQVIKPFFADKELNERFFLTGAVCITDAPNFDNLIQLPPHQMQLIYSDYIIINKAENCSPEETDSIKKRITAYNSSAQTETTTYSQTNNINLNTLNTDIQDKIEKKLSSPVLFPVVELPQFRTFTHRFPGMISLDRFKYWFNYFAAINQTDIYRVKGILYPKGEISRVIVQSVGGATTYTEGSVISPSEKIENTLVFIGKKIDFDRVVYELENYLSDNQYP